MNSEQDQLVSRIKNLEASIILLLGILKKYNIEPPVGFKSPLSVVPSPQTSQTELQMIQKNSETDISNKADSGGIPLQINLILPPLSLNPQSHTSSIITLTATASMKDTCVSTVQVNPIQVQPSISTSSPKMSSVNSVSTSTHPSPALVNIEHNEVDFQKNSQPPNKEAVYKSTNTSNIIKPIINVENISVKLPMVKDPCSTDQRKHTNRTIKDLAKSSAPVFGIDNILISSPPESNIVSSSSLLSKMSTSDTTSCTKPSVSSVKPQKNRPRLPSSGHTVAALLEPVSSIVKPTYSKTDNRTKTLVSKTETPSQCQHEVTAPNLIIETSEQSVHTTTCPISQSSEDVSKHIDSTTVTVGTGSKRWGKFVEKAHNNDSIFLSSFHLSLSTPNKSNTKRRQKKRKNKAHSDQNNKQVKSPPMKTTKVTEMQSNRKATVPENIVMCSKTATTVAQPATNSNITANDDAMVAQTSHSMTTVISEATCTTSYVGSFAVTKTTSCHQPSSMTSPPLSQARGVRNTSQKHSNTMIRTMKDRTVKNKWLSTQAVTATDKKYQQSNAAQNLHTNEKQDTSSDHSPTINICTTNTLTEYSVEQCASPVISYPNTGKRKRKLTFNSSNQQQANSNNSNLTKKHTTSTREHFLHSSGTLSVGGGNNINNVGTSQNFLAESLCRSSSNHPSHRTKKSRTERKEKETESVSHNKHLTHAQVTHKPNTKYPASTLQGYSQQRQQQPPPDLSAVNTLPTILNIFAPAPSTQLSQQQTFQSAFSNFSAENLVGSECNLGVMDTNSLNDQTFSDNMLMAANSPLFTNFSADSLIAGNDPPVPFAINNLINPSNNTWNQSWLPTDVNEAIFHNMGGSQANRQNRQQFLPSSTDSSPIKSIMSILNSAPNNASNFHLENLSSEHAHAMSNPFSSNNAQPRAITRDARINLNNSGGETTPDFMMNPSAMWFTKNTNNSLKNLSNSNMSIPPWHTFNTMQNNQLMTRPPFIKDGSNLSSNSIPIVGSLPNNDINTLTNQKLTGKTRDNTAGPMFGNISLVNSISTT